jgi:hypothetical protein
MEGQLSIPYPMDKLEAAWRQVRRENPLLMPALVDLCRQAQRRGFTQWSADALFHVLRWETGLTTGDCGLKINNNYTALAARDLMAEYPEFQGLFQLRVRRPVGVPGQLA